MGVKMGILSWIVLGLIAGVIAKFILPGDDPGGVVVTGINIVSVILAVAGAVILLIGYRMLKKRTA